MTSELWKGLLVGAVAIGLVSCKQESGSGTAPANDTSAQTENDHGHSHGEGGDHTHEGGDEAASATQGEANGGDAGEMTQESAQGTMNLFVEALKSGDFDGAAAVADETSIGYNSLTQFAESLVKAAGNPEAAALVDTLRSMYAKPWQDASVSVISEDESRAKYSVEFANEKSLEMLLTKSVDGLWQVFLPEGFLDIGRKTSETGAPDGQAGG